jgi:hypothetical protein
MNHQAIALYKPPCPVRGRLRTWRPAPGSHHLRVVLDLRQFPRPLVDESGVPVELLGGVLEERDLPPVCSLDRYHRVMRVAVLGDWDPRSGAQALRPV